MTTVETRPEQRPLSERLWNGTRYVLLAGWLLVIVATVLVGERVSSWSDVQRLVASGEVDGVQVSEELPAGSTGYAVVTVHWRDGLLHRQAQVVQAQGSRKETSGASYNKLPIVRAAPSDVLTSTAPGLQLRRDDGSSPESSAFDWLVPGWIGPASLLLFLANFGLLIAGPQPYRATPWAWGWLWLLLPPVGGIAFLLLSGPFPGAPAPKNPTRRLTGGWSFLLAIILASLFEPHGW